MNPNQSEHPAHEPDTDTDPADTAEARETQEAGFDESAAIDAEQLKIVLEAALLAAGQPLTLNQLNALFDEGEQPGHGRLREALALLDAELDGRAVELTEVAGGYRLQIRARLMPRISRMWAEKPPRYSRALLETLAIIAYRQPITRGEIEQIRGVSLSANILKTLTEREWVKAVGHRDIPGRPELLGTTAAFLDYFGLKGLDDLPTLAEIRDLDNIEPELALNDPEHDQTPSGGQDDHEAEQDTQTDHEGRPDVESQENDTQDDDSQDNDSEDGGREHGQAGPEPAQADPRQHAGDRDADDEASGEEDHDAVEPEAAEPDRSGAAPESDDGQPPRGGA